MILVSTFEIFLGTKATEAVSNGFYIDESDLIACSVTDYTRLLSANLDVKAVSVGKNAPDTWVTRFLVVDSTRLVLVEPDTSRLGWGVIRYVCSMKLKDRMYLLKVHVF